MNAKTLTACALAIVGSLGWLPGRAQDAAAIEQVMVGVSVQTRQLDGALANLGVIGKRLHGADAGCVGEVANVGRQFTGAVEEAAPVSLILRHMTAPEDIRFARVMLAIAASKVMIAADSDAQLISRDLSRISAPQAAVESVRIRDAILATRGLLATIAKPPES